MIERKGFFIYFDDVECLNKLDKMLVNLFYVSEKEKYALIYFDVNKKKAVIDALKKNPGITSFEDALTEVDKYQFNG